MFVPFLSFDLAISITIFQVDAVMGPHFYFLIICQFIIGKDLPCLSYQEVYGRIVASCIWKGIII